MLAWLCGELKAACCPTELVPKSRRELSLRVTAAALAHCWHVLGNVLAHLPPAATAPLIDNAQERTWNTLQRNLQGLALAVGVPLPSRSYA